ncbi:MAG: divergent PAP2 family protein [Nanoarchaeota archaeon]|nr:divergent PAP2 family protein [Nanoarchaeota archaeon]
MGASYIVYSVFVAGLISFVMKVLLASRSGKFDLTEGMRHGGMPSLHSAVVVSMSVSIYMLEGFSTLFTLSAIVSILFIFNLLIINGDHKTRTLRRHTFPQIVVGSLIGLVVSVALSFVQ